ncbi:SDR family oxidoreductase [Micromonospora sp. PPF5-17]|uniref:SDR family oxidoreductase n=1 Tax=Micromonospora solifontis TaxID=2487138 RepID=A0ABX9WHC6_9ACTN|nr:MULTISPECIES: SDR family oxidoreductase [Micromonospora]NES37386.1 SDR family oxidoreductase [Micromonospora solifontis]NES58069.1 SDR family oxidoreductase [Micromonospora sp. PPF5-6]RNL98394.1 SDR family oxidoreductase [Micromonospora solifontis]
MTMFDLTGRLAVVTGCRRGIGLAMAEALAGAGADIVGVSASLETEGSEAARRVEARGRTFTSYRVDLADRVAVAALAAELTTGPRPVDILVNNAGTIRRAPAAEHPDADWDEVLQVDLSTPFVLARELGRDMLARGAGRIIFTASMLSFQGGVNVVGYAAAKSAIAGVTRALANEWAGRGVNVNAIAPGYIATDNTRALRDQPERNQAILDRIPAGRWGRPDDLAGATVFLASDAAAYVHGTILAVDGGWLGR